MTRSIRFSASFGIGPETAKVDLSSKTIQYGTLGRPGDYQVFTITPKTTGIFADQISVHPTVGGLSPELLVYDSTGKNLISYADPYNGTATLTLKNEASYDVVVGSHDGNSTGSYYLGISTVVNIIATKLSAAADKHSHDVHHGVHDQAWLRYRCPGPRAAGSPGHARRRLHARDHELQPIQDVAVRLRASCLPPARGTHSQGGRGCPATGSKVTLRRPSKHRSDGAGG